MEVRKEGKEGGRKGGEREKGREGGRKYKSNWYKIKGSYDNSCMKDSYSGRVQTLIDTGVSLHPSY